MTEAWDELVRQCGRHVNDAGAYAPAFVAGVMQGQAEIERLRAALDSKADALRVMGSQLDESRGLGQQKALQIAKLEASLAVAARELAELKGGTR